MAPVYREIDTEAFLSTIDLDTWEDAVDKSALLNSTAPKQKTRSNFVLLLSAQDRTTLEQHAKHCNVPLEAVMTEALALYAQILERGYSDPHVSATIVFEKLSTSGAFERTHVTVYEAATVQ